MSVTHDALVGAGMALYGWRFWRPLDRAAADPRRAQAAVLRRILAANAATTFGAAHGFGAVRDAGGLRRPRARAALRGPAALTSSGSGPPASRR